MERSPRRSLVRSAVLAAAIASLGSCRHPAPPASPSPGPGARPGSAEVVWSYQVSAGPEARELFVEVDLARGVSEELSVDTGAEPYVKGLERREGERFVPLAPRGSSWFVPECAASGCHLRYRFDLLGAAAAVDDPDTAMALADQRAVLAPPSTWLLHPLSPQPAGRVSLRVATPPGVEFVTGLFPAPVAGSYLFGVEDLPQAPYSGFGLFRRAVVELPGGVLEVAIGPGKMRLDDEALLRWVRGAAGAVSGYYGQFPIPRALLILVPVEGRSLRNGKTLGNGGAAITLSIGRETGEVELGRDWILPHEIIHLACPTLSRPYLWLEEGLSTYVEPLARVRAGQLPVDELWRGLIEGLPNGLPEADDEGLDRTPTWGRTYWGGALFCLLADVEIRKRTHSARGLDDALRAVVRAGGNTSQRWSLERLLSVGDGGAGVPVLAELHERLGMSPGKVDLPALLRELGVRLSGRQVIFDEGAPLAEIRRAIAGPKGLAPASGDPPGPAATWPGASGGEEPFSEQSPAGSASLLVL